MLCADDQIAHPDATGLNDGRVHPEGERLCAALTAVVGEGHKRRQVDDAGIRVARRDDAAAEVPGEHDCCQSDANLTSEPRVLVVSGHAVDLEQHPETAAVDRLLS